MSWTNLSDNTNRWSRLPEPVVGGPFDAVFFDPLIFDADDATVIGEWTNLSDHTPMWTRLADNT